MDIHEIIHAWETNALPEDLAALAAIESKVDFYESAAEVWRDATAVPLVHSYCAIQVLLFTRIQQEVQNKILAAIPDAVNAVFETKPNTDFPKSQVFIGPSESGKSRAAKDLVVGKEFIWLSGKSNFLSDPFAFQALTKDTEFIIIDDVPANRLLDVLQSLFDPEIHVNKKCVSPFKLKRPHTIIICECSRFYIEDLGASFLRRFEFIEFPNDLYKKGGTQS